MKIDSIELGQDKNGNDMKIISIGNDKVFVNSKYNKEVFDAVNEESDIEIVKEGKFWKVKPESLGIKEVVYKASPSAYRKTGEIAKAMDRKEASIERHTEAKEDAMSRQGSVSDAVAIVSAQMKWQEMSSEYIREEFEKWRAFFYKKRSGKDEVLPFYPKE